jgi:small subunit ribosomal protein S8
MVNDPIGDMLTQIRNAGMTAMDTVELPYSRMKFQVASLLSKEGYVGPVAKIGDDYRSKLKIQLVYVGKAPKIAGIKRISKPGLRWYIGHKGIKPVLNGLGLSILSTSRGIMTDRDAKKLGIGGEVLCEVW